MCAAMVRLDFAPDCGITWLLPRVTSLSTSLRMVETGDISQLAAEVLQLFVRSVFASLRRRARHKYGVARYDCGSFDSRRLESHRSSSVSATL